MTSTEERTESDSQPSMAAVLESIVGPWGSIFIRVGVIVLGAVAGVVSLATGAIEI